MTTESILIVYPSGCYGHWIHWCIRYFGFREDLDIPFLSTGSSHNLHFSKMLIGIDEYQSYLNSDSNTHTIVGMHPIIRESDNLCDILKAVSTSARKTVFLTPDRHSLMLAWNNKWTKVRPDWLVNMYTPVEITEHLKMWGKAKWEDMDPWMKREFLSFWWWPARLSEHNWTKSYKKNPEWDSYPEHNGFPMLTVTLSSLRDDCKQSILDILDYLELPLQRSLDELESVCAAWAELQTHFVKDRLVDQIIHSTVNDIDFSWADIKLTLVDEATIQMVLRDLHKLDLKCYNLNVLPSNTRELKKLLTNV